MTTDMYLGKEEEGENMEIERKMEITDRVIWATLKKVKSSLDLMQLLTDFAIIKEK